MKRSNVLLVILVCVILLSSLYGYREYELSQTTTTTKVDNHTAPQCHVNLTGYTRVYNAVNITGSGTLYFNLPSDAENAKIIACANRTDGTICFINPTGRGSGQMSFNYCTPGGAICGPVNRSMVGRWEIVYNLYIGTDGNNHLEVYYD